jgi:hypothetical protein
MGRDDAGVRGRIGVVNWDRVVNAVVVIVTVVPMVVVVGVLLLTEVAGVDLTPIAESLRGGELPASPKSIAVGVVAVSVAIAGTWLVYSGAMALVMAGRIWSNDPVPAGEAHLEEGVLEVQGTAEPAFVDDEDGDDQINVRVRGKYSERPCLAYTWEKKRKKRDRHTDDNDTNDAWSTVAEGEESVPFYVADESGAVAVDPADATLSLQPSLQDRDRTGRYRVRRYEGILQPGDTVHVYGRKRTPNDGGDPFAAGRVYVDDRVADEAVRLGDRLDDESSFVGAPRDDGTFKISDTTETRTIVRSTARGVACSGLGLLLLGGVGFAALQVV